MNGSRSLDVSRLQAGALAPQLPSLGGVTNAHTPLTSAGLGAKARVTAEGQRARIRGGGETGPSAARGLQDVSWPCSLRQAGPLVLRDGPVFPAPHTVRNREKSWLHVPSKEPSASLIGRAKVSPWTGHVSGAGTSGLAGVRCPTQTRQQRRAGARWVSVGRPPQRTPQARVSTTGPCFLPLWRPEAQVQRASRLYFWRGRSRDVQMATSSLSSGDKRASSLVSLLIRTHDGRARVPHS